MAKRLTDTKKWNDDWYLSLDNDYRIIWQWLLDNCDHAGFCKRSMNLLNLLCRTKLKESEMLEAMEGRVIVHGDDWFIPKFLKFQYTNLNSQKPAILSVVKLILQKNAKHLIPESFGNDYLIITESFHNHSVMIKDKDKDMVKDKDYSEGESKTEISLEGGTGETLSLPVVENPPTPPQAAPTFDEVVTNFFAETGIASNPPGFPNWRNDCQAFLKDAYQHKALVKETGLGDAEIAKHKMDFLARLNVESDFKNLSALKKHFVNYIRKHVSANAVRGKSSAFHEPKTRNYAKASGWS